MFLEKIITAKRKEISEKEKEIPLEVLKNGIKSTKPVKSIKRAIAKDKMSIIAEIKKSSPSLGIIREDFCPKDLATDYEKNGADAISVLTEKNFFLGDESHLVEVKGNVSIPVLRKDFIISEYQIYQSRMIGADAILLIANCLSRDEIYRFLCTAHSIDLECIVEVHNEDDIKKIKELEFDVIGINNRNLDTFNVNLNTSFILKDLLPENAVVISESGIKSLDDIKSLANKGFRGVLIGELFMRSQSPGEKLKSLIEGLS